MEQFKRKRERPGKRSEQRLKTVFENVAAIRAQWQVTILRVSQRSGISITELQKMDIADFFTILKTIKKDDTATNTKSPDRARKGSGVY